MQMAVSDVGEVKARCGSTQFQQKAIIGQWLSLLDGPADGLFAENTQKQLPAHPSPNHSNKSKASASNSKFFCHQIVFFVVN